MKNEFTKNNEINHILNDLLVEIKLILEKNLIGMYLFGSLIYGNFKENSSDIDLVCILQRHLIKNEVESIKIIHEKISKKYMKWKERVECSYTPIHMLLEIAPPSEPRPYYGGGIFYESADYGYEWIINNYLLSTNSLPLFGPRFDSLIKPIKIIDVQKACLNDLFKEWEPKLSEPIWLENSHYQSYIILNLCRILYTIFCAKTGSKMVSSKWVKNKYPQWKSLITSAQEWEYGKSMLFKEQSINFIKFTIEEVKKSDLYLAQG